MKKLLGISLLSLALTVISQQEASAWSNVRFGIGANMSWQTGNNSLVWGLWRDGNVPGASTDIGMFAHKPAPNYGGNGNYGYGGFAGNTGSGQQDGFADLGPSGPAPFPGNTAAPPVMAEPPTMPRARADAEQVGYYYNYTPASYSAPYYYAPAYGYYGR